MHNMSKNVASGPSMKLKDRTVENVSVKTIPLSGVGASRIFAPRARNMCFAFCVVVPLKSPYDPFTRRQIIGE